MTRKLFVLIVATLFLCVSSALAGPLVRKDKGASNNGVADPYATCRDTVGDTCANFGATQVINGLTVVQFVQNSSLGVELSDVFQVPGTIVPGDVLTLNFAASNDNYGIFACGNGNSLPMPPGPGGSGTVTLTGPCTIGDLDFSSVGNTLLGDMVSESDTATSATFTFLTGTGFPPSWSFFSDPGGLLSYKLTTGGTTPTPEPASASLLLAGALAIGLLALKARR